MRLEPIAGVRTSNPHERQIVDELVAEGYEVLKNGWPDFLAYRESDGDIRFIEVKPNCARHLSMRQYRMATILGRLGIKVELFAARCACGSHKGWISDG